MKNDYCEFDIRVIQTTSANGTTDPPPTDPRWQLIGIGSDSNPELFGIAQAVDLFDSNVTDSARVWAGSFANTFGGAGGVLNGADSTLARWANAISGTVTHEGGHNYGSGHADSNPVTSEDGQVNHIMSTPPGENRVVDRHFSNTSFEILAANVGLYEQTVSNWDFVNPNNSDADGFRITVLVLPADGTPSKGSIYTGGLSPWGDVTITADGSEIFKGTNYDRFNIDFISPKGWDDGADGEVPAGESFHVGVGLTTDYIVRDTTLTSGGSTMDLKPRVVGYTTGGSFNPATGDFHVTFSNADPENGPLLLSDFVVRYVPRTIDINEMITGGELLGQDGLSVEPWDIRGTEKDVYQVISKTDVTMGSLSEKRAVDFILKPDPKCKGGLITPPPIGDAISPTRMEYCPEGHVIGLFPSARIYFEATVTDPNAKYYDRDLKKFVTGPLKTRIFVQLPGVKPDLNDNGIDDAVDIASNNCKDKNKNGVCDSAEPRYKYSAKIVCGLQKNPDNLRLVSGKYATAINILNPNNGIAKFTKSLSLTFPSDEEGPGEILSMGKDKLEPDQALEVDCLDVVRQIYPDGFPDSYIKGFVVLISDKSLDVTGVYTATGLERKQRCNPPDGKACRHGVHEKHYCPSNDDCYKDKSPCCKRHKECLDCALSSDTTISIDVETIRERKLAIQKPPGKQCPDLVVKDIGRPAVTCPSGGKSCEMTTSVKIANIGNSPAGGFKLLTVFDPAASVNVISTIRRGLGIGEERLVTVTTPPRGNCFDPNCTIQATVDSDQSVKECNEKNNDRKDTTQG